MEHDPFAGLHTVDPVTDGVHGPSHVGSENER
jgi:hypothetical protein